MSARGHRPPAGFISEVQRLARDTSVMVGGVNHHNAVGVGQWTINASRDPASVVVFEETLAEWIQAGFVTQRDSIQLLDERYAS